MLTWHRSSKLSNWVASLIERVGGMLLRNGARLLAEVISKELLGPGYSTTSLRSVESKFYVN